MAGFSDIELGAATFQELTLGGPQQVERAFEEIYHRLASPVLTLATRLLQDRSLAQEVVQETFIELLERGHQIRDAKAIVGWVRKVAVNNCLMRLRSPWHSRRVQGLLPEVAADAAQINGSLPEGRAGQETGGLAESLPDIEQALSRLGAETRFVIWLHDVEGYTHKEIGVLMEKTPSYSKSQLARGYETLARLYQGPTQPPTNPAADNSTTSVGVTGSTGATGGSGSTTGRHSKCQTN